MLWKSPHFYRPFVEIVILLLVIENSVEVASVKGERKYKFDKYYVMRFRYF